MDPENKLNQRVIKIYAAFVVLILISLVSLYLGSVKIPAGEIFTIFTSQNEAFRKIILDFRLPRLLNAIIVGSSLSAAGIILQSLLRNNLAEPGILGISAGAGLGAILVFTWSTSYALLTPAAFVFAIGTTFLIFYIAKGVSNKYNNFISTNKIILAGIAISALFAAINGFLLYIAGNSVTQIIFWLSGGLSGRGWNEFNFTIGFVITGLVLSFFLSKELNVLNLGEEIAASVGLNLKRLQILAIFVSALLAASAVSVAGIITFVGLIIPNISKMIIGTDHRYTIPFSIIAGSIFLVASDIIARIVIAPSELPVGIITSFLGAPIFIWLIVRRQRN
ncbi:iron ABC transporter permease [soil metagenome]